VYIWSNDDSDDDSDDIGLYVVDSWIKDCTHSKGWHNCYSETGPVLGCDLDLPHCNPVKVFYICVECKAIACESCVSKI
jgi:hypothetical protein